MHHGQNRRKQKRQLSKKRQFYENRWKFINLAKIGGGNNFVEILGNMHHWLRRMDALEHKLKKLDFMTKKSPFPSALLKNKTLSFTKRYFCIHNLVRTPLILVACLTYSIQNMYNK